jgi:hypothetical protein
VNFENLKITIKLANSICIEPKKGAFDSVLAMLYFNKLKSLGTFRGDYAIPLDFLDMSDGVYHTSFPVVEGDTILYDKEQLIKKFNHDLYAKYGEIVSKNGKGKGLVNTVQGKYKAGFFSLERISADRVSYYCRGDKEVITELLSKLHFLGKKSSLGWGKITMIEVDTIENDFSIVKDEKLMRNLPKQNSFNITNNKRTLFRLTHPYWKKSGLVECLMP